MHSSLLCRACTRCDNIQLSIFYVQYITTSITEYCITTLLLCSYFIQLRYTEDISTKLVFYLIISILLNLVNQYRKNFFFFIFFYFLLKLPATVKVVSKKFISL